MPRDTVGKISSELLQKEPETRDPIEIQREVHKNFEEHLYACIDTNKKEIQGDFYVVVLTKKERLMKNVLRNFFFARKSCPTPEYDQAVYQYFRNGDGVRFLWVVPAKDVCEHLKDNALIVSSEEKDLLHFVLDFADGTLLRLSKRLNGEKVNSPLLEK